MMDRKVILESAIECVTGHRVEDHGRPEDSFKIIANLWEAYTGHEYTAQDVAIMLGLLKVGRIASGQGSLDNYIDLAGYAACAGEMYARAKEADTNDPHTDG